MIKRIYISADYDESNGDRVVVDELNRWGQDDLHKVNFVDMSKVKSGSVSKKPDCRICDLKAEFNSQINASSSVIFVVGDKTGSRTAGSECPRAGKSQIESLCTPYKENCNGKKFCKVVTTVEPGKDDDFGYINSFSYLRHEFEQTIKKKKNFLIVYNSTRNETSWIPSYMKGYECRAVPFWKYNESGNKVGDYTKIKEALGYD